MKIIRTIEISKKEERILDGVYEKFRESSLGDYYDFGEAIAEMIDYDENYVEDFLISYSDLEIIKNIFKEFSDFMLYNDFDFPEFIENLLNKNFCDYKIEVVE